MEKYKISIILPIKEYNLEDLTRCINSILTQNYVNFEIIVKCNSEEIDFLKLKELFTDPRLIFLNKQDFSITEAINQAAEVSTGQIMTVFAHDDYYLPGSFETLENSIDDSKWYFGKINYHSRGVLKPTYYTSNPNLEDMKSNNMIPQPACFWKREVYEEVGKFDEGFKLCWDYDYWVRIMKNYIPKYIDFIFANYYLNDNSISLKYPDLMNVEKELIIKKHF